MTNPLLNSVLLLPLCCFQLVVGIEYPYASADTSAYHFQADTLTTKSSSTLPHHSKAKLVEFEFEHEDVDAWMDEWELETSSLSSSSSSSYSPPMSRLSVHLEQSITTRTAAIDKNHYDDDDDKINNNNNNALMTLNKSLLKKTGTTIAGCCVDQHVILAADTRATEETMVADKTCQKLHPLARNAWCAGAGTSADLDHLTKECMYSMALQSLQQQSIGNDDNDNDNSKGSLELHQEQDGTDLLFLGSVSIHQLCRFFQESLFQAGGQLGANLILGGVSEGKAYLRALHPHGSMDIDLPFAALGSGGLAAMGILEDGYASINTVEDGIALCQQAIVAGIKNDLGSGSQVDICVMYPNGTSKLQRCVVPEETLQDEFRSSSKSIAAAALPKAEEATMPSIGVNGFGNLPFAIESKKIRLVSVEESEEERLAKWNSILGLLL
jgi:20S proteasome subunit beta 2